MGYLIEDSKLRDGTVAPALQRLHAVVQRQRLYVVYHKAAL